MHIQSPKNHLDKIKKGAVVEQVKFSSKLAVFLAALWAIHS